MFGCAKQAVLRTRVDRIVGSAEQGKWGTHRQKAIVIQTRGTDTLIPY